MENQRRKSAFSCLHIVAECAQKPCIREYNIIISHCFLTGKLQPVGVLREEIWAALEEDAKLKHFVCLVNETL